MNIKILTELRTEAIGRLRFTGGWSGYWYTRIDGINYRSAIMSGFRFLTGDCGSFVQDAILHRLKLKRDKKAESESLQLCGYGREYRISEKGEIQPLWTIWKR